MNNISTRTDAKQISEPKSQKGYSNASYKNEDSTINNDSFASIDDGGIFINHGPRTSSLKRDNDLTNSMQSTPSSLRERKKDYHQKKKILTRNVQSAIESTQEVHSGWLKARTNIKSWSKVWCQVKPGYLILYSSQEALKKHRLGVILLPVCQVIKRPTRKEGFCFKLINPLDCSVWVKTSTKALIFAQASLTLRVSDESIGKLWLDALHKCNLSNNLEGYKSFIDEERGLHVNCSQGSTDSEDGDQSTKQLGCIFSHSNTTSESNSISSFQNQNVCAKASGKPFLNGGGITGMQNGSLRSRMIQLRVDVNSAKDSNDIHESKLSSQLGHNDHLNNNFIHNNRNNQVGQQQKPNLSDTNYSKMVVKLSKYTWKELQLERVSYIGEEFEELGTAGIQTEELRDESNKNLLWHIIKQLRPGMDLSKVTLPTFILEPRSFLEKLADYYYHCDILSDAVLIEDPLLRLINIVKWYLSGFYKKPKGPKKPYNPILGERFRCFWDHPKTQSRTFFIAEQVSHHPPISAFHVSNRKDGFNITCALLSRSKYAGNSVSAILDGKARLHLTKRNETYILTMPYANCRGILLGSLCLELGGRVEIECAQTKCKCELDFKIAPMWASASSYNSLTGRILKDNKVTHTLDGHWDKKIDIVDKQIEHKSTLWEVNDAIRNSRLKRYVVSFHDQDDRESVKLWAKVTEALTTGDQTIATAEKTRLEDIQRQEARDRHGTFMPQHFEFRAGQKEWLYKWQDIRPWDERRDITQFEEEFKIRTLMLEANYASSGTYNSTIDLPLTQVTKFADQVRSFNGITERSDCCAVSKGTENLKEITDQDTFRTIESKIAAGNLLFEEAIRQVNEKNRRLEEDIALLKRAKGKRTLAFLLTLIIVALMAVFFNYFA